MVLRHKEPCPPSAEYISPDYYSLMSQSNIVTSTTISLQTRDNCSYTLTSNCHTCSHCCTCIIFFSADMLPLTNTTSVYVLIAKHCL